MEYIYIIIELAGVKYVGIRDRIGYTGGVTA
jgi:hypothetical protein